MKCYIYAFYNKKIGAYEKPIVNNYQKEDFTQLVVRDVLVSDNAAKDRMKECDLYELGTYDDVLGVFDTHKPEFILALDTLIDGKKPEMLEGDVNA